MKKSDLKAGMRVETREGRIYLVVTDVEFKYYGLQKVAFFRDGAFLVGDSYRENLMIDNLNDKYDIVKVHSALENSECGCGSMLDLKQNHCIWERDEFDLSKVEVDAPILVSHDGINWKKRHFCKLRNNRVYTFDSGCTSWSQPDYVLPSGWNYAKLPNILDKMNCYE